MPRIGILNLFIGFFLLFLSSCCGAFLASDTSYALLQHKDLLTTWGYVLRKSAHSHTNLFGFLHISFGLTLPYSLFSSKIKKIQTLALLAGSFAMSFLLLTRSYFPIAQNSSDFLGILTALLLSTTLLSLASHSFALYLKLQQR